MRLTAEYLIEHGSCVNDTNYFLENYPDGAELIDLINDPKITTHMLHWGFNHLPVSPEEMRAYQERLKIVNCSVFNESENISNCERIFDSHRCSNSKSIFHSDHVDDSEYVTGARVIKNSQHISNSSYITDSKFVTTSKNVTNGENIVEGNYVINGRNIIGSNLITNSQEILHSNNIKNSIAIGASSNLNHCCFCFGLNDKADYMFNAPADPDVLMNTFAQYFNFVNTYWPLMHEDNQVVYTAPTINYRQDQYWSVFGDIFWEWIETLPNFNPKIVYQLTLNPYFLKKI